MGKWRIIKDPIIKSDLTFEFGSRGTELPSDAIITITRMEGMSKWRMAINNVVSLAVMYQMSKSRGLLYAEISGKTKERGGNTLSVWKPRDMVPFRDSGSHKFAMKYFRWIFGGRDVHSYFLTWKLDGPIPRYAEARELVVQYGNHYVSNQLVRRATRPTWPRMSDLSVDQQSN